MENSNRVERSELFVKIRNIVKTLPIDSKGMDAPDCQSVSADLEKMLSAEIKSKKELPVTTRVLSKRELRNELFGILSMCDAFLEEGSMVGGKRKEELIKYLPKQIASSIMNLQDLIEKCRLM